MSTSLSALRETTVLDQVVCNGKGARALAAAMRTRPLHVCLFSVCAAFAVPSAVCPGQAVVSPPENTTREGNSWSSDPFGNGVVPSKHLQVHEDVVGPRTITKLSFRPDDFALVPANSFVCRITLAEAPPSIDAGNPPSTIPQPLGTNAMAYPPQPVDWVAEPYIPGEPLPRRHSMTLTLPSPYQLNAGKRLIWLVEISGRTGSPGATLLDAVSGPASGFEHDVLYGVGCARAGSAPPMGHDLTLAVDFFGLTMDLQLEAVEAVAGQPVVFVLGVAPFLPGLPWCGAASGCSLYVDPILVDFPVLADPTGYARYIAGGMRLAASSFNLYSQAVALSPSSPCGSITSNGHQKYVALPTQAPPPVGSLTQLLLNTPVPAPRSGLVVRFE